MKKNAESTREKKIIQGEKESSENTIEIYHSHAFEHC